MSAPNPYTPPSAPIADTSQSGAESLAALNRIASGQRHVIYALLVQIVAYGLARGAPQIGLLFVAAAFVYAVVSVVRLAQALGYSVVSRVLLCIGLLIPLVSLLVLAVLSSRASQKLRAGGFKIGLLGAKPREV
jgi:tetrahydromethanopterin S-methyltransferase subunit C